MHEKALRGFAALVTLGALLFSACGEGGLSGQDRYLYKMAGDESLSDESRFTAVNTLAAHLTAAKDYPLLIVFLNEYTAQHREDRFRPYYLLLTAYAYLETGSPPMAEIVFDRIVRSRSESPASDLLVKEESVHYRCLRELLALSSDPGRRIFYYTTLMKDFADKVDPGEMYFRIGTEYEKLGDWKNAAAAYTAFTLQNGAPSLVLSGYTEPYAYARKMTGLLSLESGTKNWTFDTLDDLAAAVKSALADHNYYALDSYKSRVNFFAMSWKQSEGDRNAVRSFYLRNFMSGRTIYFANEIDESSRPGEAYLRTWGWSQQSTSWYFVFRRVNFPANSDIHGRWEWAGIYYGERF